MHNKRLFTAASLTEESQCIIVFSQFKILLQRDSLHRWRTLRQIKQLRSAIHEPVQLSSKSFSKDNLLASNQVGVARIMGAHPMMSCSRTVGNGLTMVSCSTAEMWSPYASHTLAYWPQLQGIKSQAVMNRRVSLVLVIETISMTTLFDSTRTLFIYIMWSQSRLINAFVLLFTLIRCVTKLKQSTKKQDWIFTIF